MDDPQDLLPDVPRPLREYQVVVTMALPRDGDGRASVFADAVHTVTERLAAGGVVAAWTAERLLVAVPVRARDRGAAVLEAARLAEDAAGGWLVVDGAEAGRAGGLFSARPRAGSTRG